MVAKKDNNKTVDTNGMEDFFRNIVIEMENRSLQVIKNQKEMIDGTREQLCQLEENSKKLTTEWKTNVQSLFEKANSELDAEYYQEWLNKVEEIGHKSHSMAVLPAKTSLDFLSKSNEQFEEAYTNAVAQNRKMREETEKAFEGFSEQIKQIQASMFKFFELRPNLSK